MPPIQQELDLVRNIYKGPNPGKKAPYETKQVRVPVPLEPWINALKAEYWNHCESGGDPHDFRPESVRLRDALQDAILDESFKASSATSPRWSQAQRVLKRLRDLLPPAF